MNYPNIFSRKNRILLKELVITDFKLRYQGSVLGYLWSLLKPLLLFVILYLVFVRFLRFGSDIEHFPIYLLLGVVLWGFFNEATTQGMHSIVSRGDLIRKVNFPKYIIIVSSTISALINLIINLVVVGVFMVINGVEFQTTALLIPLNIIELYVLALATSSLLAGVIIRYRDIGHIWEVILQGAFYAVPIIYPMSLVISYSETAAKVLLLNPIAKIIQDFRYNLITHQTVTTNKILDDTYYWLIPYAITAGLVLLAVWYFRKYSRYFAEDI